MEILRAVRLAVVLPTFNEPELLRECMASLEFPRSVLSTILIVNAGDPLGFELPANAVEIKVPSDHFWTASVAAGLEYARAGAFDFVMLANADNTFLPGSVEKLLRLARSGAKIVASSPAYIQVGEEPVELLYSDQLDLGILLFGKLNRRWNVPAEAPVEPFEIELTGGQGVVFSTRLLEDVAMDPDRFPHHAGDHDFWLQARKKGWTVMVEPQAGIVNRRVLGGKHAVGTWAKVGKLIWRLRSDLTQDSPRVMWRLRAKHLPLPVALVSFLLSFGMRWTIGFPKLLKRS